MLEVQVLVRLKRAVKRIDRLQLRANKTDRLQFLVRACFPTRQIETLEAQARQIEIA